MISFSINDVLLQNSSEVFAALWTLQLKRDTVFDNLISFATPLFFLNGGIFTEKEDGGRGGSPPPAESQNVTQPSGYNAVINCWHSWGSRHKLILTHLQTAGILQRTLCNYILGMEIKWHLKPGCHARWSGHILRREGGWREIAVCWLVTQGWRCPPKPRHIRVLHLHHVFAAAAHKSFIVFLNLSVQLSRLKNWGFQSALATLC